MKRTKCGFTLVELLVVISIIAFLLAIIVPALGRAKDKSKLLVCRSRLHGLVTACRAYANSNNSKFPLGKKLDNPHKDLITMLSGGDYVDSRGSYYCPSEKKEGLRNTEENFAAGNISYFYFCYTEQPVSAELSNHILHLVRWPRRLDDTMRHNTWVFSDGWYSGTPTAHRWYKKGVNYAVLDGSVHMVKSSPRSEFK